MSAVSASADVRDLDIDGDTLREECGVFGIYGHDDASAIVALGLHALQHRGQEAAGIVSFDGERFQTERRLGLKFLRPQLNLIGSRKRLHPIIFPQN